MFSKLFQSLAQKFNVYHDDAGRFTSKDRAVQAGHRAIPTVRAMQLAIDKVGAKAFEDAVTAHMMQVGEVEDVAHEIERVARKIIGITKEKKKKKDFGHILKMNPYHDGKGKFTSKELAVDKGNYSMSGEVEGHVSEVLGGLLTDYPKMQGWVNSLQLIASSTNHFDAFDKKIQISGFGLDKSLTEVDRDADTANPEGFNVRGGLKALLTHEFAHAIDHFVRDVGDDSVKDEWFDTKKRLEKELGSPSEYGKTNTGEWFAERFTAEKLGQVEPALLPIIAKFHDALPAKKRKTDMFSHVLKANPYHDHKGRFTSARNDSKNRLLGESDKGYAKRVVDKEPRPTSLPEKHSDYFNMQGATVVPMEKLVSGKTQEENAQGLENGAKRMAAAAQGRLGKRDPITVEPMDDGRYLVVDGNGTFSTAQSFGWKEMPVQIQEKQRKLDFSSMLTAKPY